jgi:hypothetical protein
VLSDEALIALFNNHRGDFEKLQRMTVADAGKSVLDVSLWDSRVDFTGRRLSDSRFAEYRSLIWKIDSGMIILAGGGDNRTVRFLTAGGGVLSIGPEWWKGLEFIPHQQNYKELGEVKDTLDVWEPLPYGIYLRPIEPEWFIIYENLE